MERKYDPADLSSYLNEAEGFQTFSNDPLDVNYLNTYSGCDDLSISPIQDEYIYAVIHDGNIAQIEKGEPLNVSYFFDQATYDKFVDPSTGAFDAAALSEALQLDPAGYPTYRNSIACFKVNHENVSGGVLSLPTGICSANTQFGGGGGHQTFAPKDISMDLQKSGALQINQERSHFHTGINTAVSAERQAIVDAGVAERQNNCIENGTPHHDISITYSAGFDPTPDLVGGQPFDQTHGVIEPLLAEVVDVVKIIEEEAPPNLHDLNSFLIEASEKLGITAAEVADCLQHIYEEGDATYPRTDSNCITSDMENTVASILSDTGNNS